MPYYFTGTNSKASGSVYGNAPIEHCYLYIGGEVAKEWHADSSEMPMSMGLSVVFDSTEFPTNFEGGVNLTVKILATDVNGFPYSDEDFAPVMNRAFTYDYPEADGYQDWPGYVVDHLLDLNTNYASTYRADETWPKQVMEEDWQNTALIFIMNHAEENTLRDALGQPIYGVSQNPPSVLGWRQSINGTGLPPYNSSHKPYVTFVDLSGCEANQSNKFKAFFYPDFDWYGGHFEDQAVFGWSLFVAADEGEVRADHLWPHLLSGRTVHWARDSLVQDCIDHDQNSDDGSLLISVSLNAINWRGVETSDDCPVWADFYTRIRGVYTGDDTWPPDWKR